MKALILGYGISGRAAEAFLKKEGAEVVVVDSKEATVSLEGFDLIVKSPGVPMTHPLVSQANIPVIGEVDLGLKVLAERGKKMLVVTGSNGKTTTTLLTAHVLGKRAVAVGNVGVALTSQIDNPAEIFVVELSSFQLETLAPAPIFDGGVILNITPNHLDRHTSFEAYVEAKCRLQEGLKPEAPLFASSQVIRDFSHCLKVKVETIAPLRYEVSRLSHDLENFSAAWALAQTVGLTEEEFFARIATFEKPPHRLEVVGQWDGITYVNDSKATSVDAVKKAVAALCGNVILIAGGVDKGGAFAEWNASFRGKVRCVLALGEAAPRIVKEMGEAIPIETVSSLEEGVAKARRMAEKGDTVLLSPGCSSYDQFTDYQHRGNVFKQLVRGKG